MKIGNSPSTDGTASTAKAEQRPAARKADSTATTEATRTTASTTPAASTQVAISDAAQIAAASSSSDDGSFDAAKVDRIAKAISEGKFTVNANAIADKLVSNAQELLSARSTSSSSSNKH